MKKISKKIVDSFNYAIEGIIYAARTQRNMRIEIIAALIVLTACFFYDMSKVEVLILLLTMTMVIAAELINTAIEATIDVLSNHYHPLAKIAKNTAAGAVLITSLNAVIVGYILFWEKLKNITFNLALKMRSTDAYLILLVVIMVCMIVIIIKAIYGEGTPLRGGMPSGHSAISFSIATIISLYTTEPTVMVLSYLLAVIVAQSRVDSNTHSFLETFVGGLLGVALTIFIFKVFNLI